MERVFTEEQEKAIRTRDRSLLVSAAAGSGKTAVLVERILREILDPGRPVDLDRILVVTFTRAATAQLRERVRDAVTSRYESSPADARLQHQMSLLYSDHIMTIDKFFLMVIREHYEEIRLDPSFRIGDEGELKLMRSEVVSDVLEEAYQKGEEDFLRFSDCYASGNSDKALEDMILDFWESSTSHAYPGEWRHQCLKAYQIPSSGWKWLALLTDQVREQLGEILGTIDQAQRICRSQGGPAAALPAILSDRNMMEKILECSSYEEMGQAFSQVDFSRIVKKPKKGEAPYDPRKTRLVSDLRDDWKKRIQQLKERFFMRPLPEEEKLERKTGEDVAVLVRLADRFEERFREEKTRKNMLDFSDISHLALQVLIHKKKNGELVPCQAAEEYRNYFEEIAIDEYQDSNEIQELLLSAVSGESAGKYNRFMVGDVKQSIYRFRMSDPGIFLEKYEHYKRADEDSDPDHVKEHEKSADSEGPVLQARHEGESKEEEKEEQKEGQKEERKEEQKESDRHQERIDLHRNFRSRKEVLNGINLIFRQIMRREVGGISYGREESLYPGASFLPYPEPWKGQEDRICCPELILVQPDDIAAKPAEEIRNSYTEDGTGKPEKPENPTVTGVDFSGSESGTGKQTPDKVHAEAEVTAARILQMVGRDPVWDKEKSAYRPAEFRDIVILLRTASGWANVYSQVLSQKGIPNRSGSRTGYFSSPEVQTILSYLNVLDNPRQDIPLAASLRSDIGGLDDNDLARIKAGRRRDPLYDCVQDYLREHTCPEGGSFEETGKQLSEDQKLVKKLTVFIERTRSLRSRVPDTPIHQLLWQIYDETGFADLCQASPGGSQKKANLDMLVEKAMAYEQTSYRGLFHFVRYIEKMIRYEVDMGAALSEGGNENLVRIMTIHSSKGLEFPIVFVAGLGKQFNRRDAGAQLVEDPVIGMGMNYVDPDLRVKVPTLIRSAASERVLREDTGEELRILYVAMTRAEEKLILIGSVKDREEAAGSLVSCASCMEEKLPVQMILGGGSFLFWVMAALVRHVPEEEFFRPYLQGMTDNGRSPVSSLPGRFRILTGRDVMQTGRQEALREEKNTRSLFDADPSRVYDPELRERLRRQFSSVYPYPDLSKVPAKVTVSELKRAAYEEELSRAGQEYSDAAQMFPPGPAFREKSTGKDRRDPGRSCIRPFPAAVLGSGSSERTQGFTVRTKDGGVSGEGPESDGDPVVPEFMKEEKGAEKITPAGAGTLVHRFLADYDFTLPTEEGGAERWLERMIRCDKITEDERKIIRVAPLDRFLRSGLGIRIRKAAERGTLHRENPFVLSVPAGQLYPDLSSEAGAEPVLIQGTIDVWFQDTDGRLVLIDYKTDHVGKGEEELLLRRYRIQLSMYREALQRLTGREVGETWLYSFALGKAIPDRGLHTVSDRRGTSPE